MQTNLVHLDDERIRLLTEGFDRVSTSIDHYGSLRVNIAGRDSNQKVLDNLRRVQAAGIRVGCITVLTRQNVHKLDEIFQFYEDTGTYFRVLPLFEGATGDQNTAFALTLEEELTVLCRLADLWLESDRVVRSSKDRLRARDLAAGLRATWLVREASPAPPRRHPRDFV